MRNKTINELTGLENPRLTDTLPIWDGTEGKTKKVSLAKIPANVITPVDSLPESPNILDRVYRYNNKYYVGNESAQTLTELASKADIPTVVDTVADGNMNPVTSNAVYDKFNTVETIPITPNSHVTSGTITCKKWGHYVEVNLQSVITDIPGGNSNVVFASGFPKPAINVQYNCITVHANASGAIGSVNITQTGDMNTAWAEGSQTVTYQGSFTYLSAD